MLLQYRLEQVSSCAPHLSSRRVGVYTTTCALCRPVASASGYAVMRAAQGRGKGCAGWTASTAWLNAGHILRLHQSLRGQPTICHFTNTRSIPDSSDPLVCFSMHTAISMPAYMQCRCTSICIRFFPHVEPRLRVREHSSALYSAAKYDALDQ